MMDDRELDSKLEAARDQSEKFFKKLSFEESRKIVHKRIENMEKSRVDLYRLRRMNTNVYLFRRKENQGNTNLFQRSLNRFCIV